jgi:hypothetical protein
MRKPIAVLGLLAAGCGPAPYAVSPDPPANDPAPQPSTVYVLLPPPKGAAPPAPVPEPEDRWIPDGIPQPNPFVQHPAWTGKYDCTQGVTELKLRIIDVRGKVVRAVFDFYHAPSGAAGSYLVAGTYDEDTRKIVFEPGVWFTQPEGYVSVGMEGEVSRDASLFAGKIPAPGCSGFRLKPAM